MLHTPKNLSFGKKDIENNNNNKKKCFDLLGATKVL